MSVYAGIEKIDPMERIKHHEITKALWQKLNEMGLKTGAKGRIKAYLVSNLYEQAKGVEAQFKGGFEVTVYKQEESSKYIIELITPISRLSIEALEELADILMISAVETNTEFDGFELDINEVKKLNTPWWKFW